MKHFLLVCVSVLMALPLSISADVTVNLTPLPKSMTEGDGELELPESFTIAVGSLPDSMVTEVEKFVEEFTYVTGYSVTTSASSSSGALFTVSQNSDLSDEAYNLDITTDGVSIEAATTAGLYYAFQTVKKILPANVMAGVQDSSVESYVLPVVSIEDEPRFSYRGFMLDVSRHFFTVEDVERMLDVMSYYKMNRFHWHLTDDQGWRIEINKYPKLTSVGSIAPNSRFTDMTYGMYWINQAYGPYYYTQEELKEVVEYAKERHIEIIPEIDMPGHFVAALVAYPEYSCTPYEARTVWTSGGVSSDILNVANERAVDFVKDILDEIMDIFPYELIHVGGDECPTTYWQANDECIAAVEEGGLESFRELQSLFIKELSDYVGEQGRRVAVWNEAITADSADTDLIQQTDATIYCWTGATSAAKTAATLGLRNVYTPQPEYYINRKQSTDASEPAGAGTGSDSVRTVYEEEALPSSVSSTLAPYYTGVQGTFWTEYVSDRTYMEYLALPRLIAIAEAGWTQRDDKDYDSFRERVMADTVLLNYGNYNYGRHIMTTSETETEESETDTVMPLSSTETSRVYYRIVTLATSSKRADRCWELLSESSDLIEEYGDDGAAVNVLWSNDQADEDDDNYDYQMWAFEEDPDREGRYALVCKVFPDGSLNPTPSEETTSGRWSYDENEKNYGFVLGEYCYGEEDGSYYYSIRSEEVEDLYLYSSLSSQGYSVNLYKNPTSGDAGMWLCVREADASALTELVDSISNMLDEGVPTYDDEKTLGAYGASELAALQAAVESAEGQDFDTMSDTEMENYSETISEAYEAFMNSFGYLEEGGTYRFTNSLEEFADRSIYDDGSCDYVLHTSDEWTEGELAGDAWKVTQSTLNDDYTQTVVLMNVATGRYVGEAESSAVAEVAYPMDIATEETEIVISYNQGFDDYTVSEDGLNLFPVPEGSTILPSIVSAGSSIDDTNAERPAGGVWNIEEVEVVTYECSDDEGTDLGVYSRSLPLTETDYDDYCPELTGYELKSASMDGTTVTALYERTAYLVTTFSHDTYGAWIEKKVDTCLVGENYTVELPDPDYYTLQATDYEDGTVLTPTEDMTVEAIYTTDAYSGVKSVAETASSLEDGHSYLIYDNSSANEGARKGFRFVIPTTNEVNRILSAEGASPYATWVLEGSSSSVGFLVKNEYLGTYVPEMSTEAVAPVMSDEGMYYSFTTNDDGSWCITGTNDICWDGIADGSLVGWTSPGHPYLMFEYYVAPYFEITLNSVTEADSLLATATELVEGGTSYTPYAESIDGYEFVSFDADGDLDCVSDHLTVTLTYAVSTTGISSVTVTETAKDDAIYDLSGRRLNRIQSPGIYIKNAQKILVK